MQRALGFAKDQPNSVHQRGGSLEIKLPAAAISHLKFEFPLPLMNAKTSRLWL